MRLRQSIKCGFITRLTVVFLIHIILCLCYLCTVFLWCNHPIFQGEIQEKARVLHSVKVNDVSNYCWKDYRSFQSITSISFAYS